MKNKHNRSIKCSHEGCKEFGYFTFDSYKELSNHYSRVKEWKCIRHTNPDSVLSIVNLSTSETLITKELLSSSSDNSLGLFWQKEINSGTNKCESGFQHGNGYKAYANDFPEGTKLIITAKIILPK